MISSRLTYVKHLRSKVVRLGELWRTKSVAIMPKFPHRPATLTNREREREKGGTVFLFLNLFPFHVPNETEFKALWFYEPSERPSRSHFFPQSESTTVSLHRPSFSRFRCSSPRPRPLAPQKGEAREKRNRRPTTFRHPATPRLRGTRSDYRSYTYLPFFSAFLSPVFFVAIITRERAERWFIFLHDPPKVDGGGEDDEDWPFAILNHRLSGWYPLSSHSTFALSCAMPFSTLVSLLACWSP